MYDLIKDFPDHLLEALSIGRNAKLKAPDAAYANVVITGLGGSGIGGRIASQAVAREASCPIEVFSNYYLPAYVGKGSLVIACSYSGNTEETLAAMEQALANGARVVCITSGGAMLETAKAKSLDHIVIPGGNPPRTMLAYSLTQQFFILKHFGIIRSDFEASIGKAALKLKADQDAIKAIGKDLAGKLHGKRTIIYSEAATEAVSIRFRQQVNENSKELCWHHAIPEMNHNELVGWAGGDNSLSVVIFRHKDDHARSQVRMEINKEVFAKHTPHIHEVWSQGDDHLGRQIYLVHLGDWASWFLAELKGVDAIEIGVINMLKEKLAGVK
ncbi:MAG: bifunctional phosphoglucose/phosphomannose isomerase [Flavobacteriales bacterium]|nr:bifunctional phosphoglucose/phosphomannose isomerase [Flavobacteriales bacterium]